ncbi:hypothetical protein AC578_7177 [Pseudocercospora eumusae]|uniref:Uncharacterized protein n=1 Tax=Pseudocercospora eumusae TaxID=321146 RepID=A0A139HX66_9PEZI|nr:hypothetical protein AC578_7177 [Pseudocercospora eumusae]
MTARDLKFGTSSRRLIDPGQMPSKCPLELAGLATRLRRVALYIIKDNAISLHSKQLQRTVSIMLAIAPSSSPNHYAPTHSSPLSPLSANIYGRPRHMLNTTTNASSQKSALNQEESQPQENNPIFQFKSVPNQRTPFSRRPIKLAPTSNPDTIKEKRRSNFLRKVSIQREEKRYEARGEDFMRLDFMQRQRAWEAEREKEAASSQNLPEEEDEDELPGWDNVQPKEEVEEFVRDEEAELEAMLENMPQPQDRGEDSGMWSDGADYDELFDEIMTSQQGHPASVHVDDEMDMS